MSYICSHINVHDKDGHFHQIFDVKVVKHYHPTDSEKKSSRELVNRLYQNYKSATLHIMHYDKNDYNDKNNRVKL